MSHSTKFIFLKRTLTVAAVAVTAVGSIFYVQEFAKIDPLVNMRKRNMIAPDELGISLGKVSLVQYRGAKRVAEANVDKVFIPSNRSQYQMVGVTDGAYITDAGKRVNFEAPTALWNASGRILSADEARVWNKDIDLKTHLFRVNEREETLYVPGSIRGRFFGGQLQASNLKYLISKEEAITGPMHWAGKIGVSPQGEETKDLKRWEFESDGQAKLSIKNKLKIWEKVTVTDGEVILKADRFEHDEKTDVLTAIGNVKYYSVKANMTCAKAVVYRKEKRAVLTGAVDMLVKPKNKQTKPTVEEIPPFRPLVPEDVSKDRPSAPVAQRNEQDKKLDQDVQSPKTLRDYPLVVTSAKIEYWYGKGSRRAIITGDPQARQELPAGRWRHVWAHKAFYDGEKETLKMESREGQTDTRLKNSIGDDIVASVVTVSTKEDDEDMEAVGVKGKVYGTSDDDGVGPKGPDPIKPGNGGGGLQGPIRGGGRNPGRRS